MMTIQGDLRTGNCLKVKTPADTLGLAYDWRDGDVLAGGARTPQMLALNPAGQIPVVSWDDGRALAQSNAIIRYLAAGTDLLPADPFAQAKVDAWLFWEQYSHEPYVAVARFQVVYRGLAPDALDANLVTRANAALGHLDAALADAEWLANDAPSVADIACAAYSRLAPEAGLDLEPLPRLRSWLARCDARFA